MENSLTDGSYCTGSQCQVKQSCREMGTFNPETVITRLPPHSTATSNLLHNRSTWASASLVPQVPAVIYTPREPHFLPTPLVSHHREGARGGSFRPNRQFPPSIRKTPRKTRGLRKFELNPPNLHNINLNTFIKQFAVSA